MIESRGEMQIHCRSCGKPIPAEDVNLDTVLAKCRVCHAVFDFSGQVRLEVTPEAKRKRDRGEIPMPRQFQVEEQGLCLTITRRWGRGSPAMFLLVFSGIWNLLLCYFLIGTMTGLIELPEGREDTPPWLIFFFLFPFVLTGIASGWMAIGLRLNRTTIRVEGGRLTVSHAPVWWPGNCGLDTETVDQLYCEEYAAYESNDMPQYRFAVRALLKDGSKFKLVQGMEDAGQALYLEQLLEKHLGIADRPVRGEFQGGPFD